MRVYGMAVIAAMTAQNTSGVSAVAEVSADFVAQQLETVLTDIRPDAVKTGMLLTTGVIEAVAHNLKSYDIANLVVDPVMTATSGAPLMKPEATKVFREKLLPLAFLITPNIDETRVMTGKAIRNTSDMEEAAVQVHDMGPRYVLI